jgi:hypothetical protein
LAALFVGVPLDLAPAVPDFLAREAEDLSRVALDDRAFAPEAFAFEPPPLDALFDLGEFPFELCADAFFCAEELVLA